MGTLELHRPVMLNEVIEYINVNGGDFLDLTFGEGGHSHEILSKGVKTLVGVDRDGEAIQSYRKSGLYRDDPRLKLLHCPFSKAESELAGYQFDGVVMDLGVSTRQLMDSERGFSFLRRGPLDMRMNRSEFGTLEERLRELSETELASQLRLLANISNAAKLSNKLIQAFRRGTCKTTLDLASLVPGPRGKRHPATQLFLALRMLVNDELDEIRSAIPRVIKLLKPGGRIVVISFHSVEDKLVKTVFKSLSGKCVCQDSPCVCPGVKILAPLHKKAIAPGHIEIRTNPRARSAKLRAAQKL